jgi:hypothetical protein
VLGSEEEDEMNRRELLIAGLSVPFVTAATAAKIVPDDLYAQVKGPDELWFIVNAIEAMIFLTLSVKNPEDAARTRRDFIPYGQQLTSQDAVQRFNNALQSKDGMERAKQASESINNAADTISTNLSGTSCSEGVRTTTINAFKRGSILLSAASSDNLSWWCHLYGFRILCPNEK